jgi:hypothetical protein
MTVHRRQFTLYELFVFTTLLAILLGFASVHPWLLIAYAWIFIAILAIEFFARLAGIITRPAKERLLFWLLMGVILSALVAVIMWVTDARVADRPFNMKNFLAECREMASNPRVVGRLIVMVVIISAIGFRQWYAKRKKHHERPRSSHDQ